jgi:hypothetical protein
MSFFVLPPQVREFAAKAAEDRRLRFEMQMVLADAEATADPHLRAALELARLPLDGDDEPSPSKRKAKPRPKARAAARKWTKRATAKTPIAVLIETTGARHKTPPRAVRIDVRGGTVLTASGRPMPGATVTADGRVVVDGRVLEPRGKLRPPVRALVAAGVAEAYAAAEPGARKLLRKHYSPIVRRLRAEGRLPAAKLATAPVVPLRPQPFQLPSGDSDLDRIAAFGAGVVERMSLLASEQNRSHEDSGALKRLADQFAAFLARPERAVRIEVPRQEPPVVNVEAPQVTVQPPDVHVTVEAPKPKAVRVTEDAETGERVYVPTDVEELDDE